MFGALSTHYRREEERRLQLLQQQQQRRLQQQRAAVAAQAAALNAKKMQSLPVNGQYVSRSRTPDPPRKGVEQPPPYRSQSSRMPASQLRNGDVGRVLRMEEERKQSRSDGSYSSSSSEEESEDEPPPPPKPTAKARKDSNEWKVVSVKAKTVREMSRGRKKVAVS